MVTSCQDPSPDCRPSHFRLSLRPVSALQLAHRLHHRRHGLAQLQVFDPRQYVRKQTLRPVGRLTGAASTAIILSVRVYRIWGECKMSLVISDDVLELAHMTATELAQEIAVLLYGRDKLTLGQVS